jgi:UDP:flavonoid glycosyltransferase YjiC (YdhE family)
VRFAQICSAHGFGHVTRQLEVARRLEERGVETVLFTAAPLGLVREWLSTTRVVPWVVDVGVMQTDSVTEDVPATRRLLDERCSERAVDRLASALVEEKVDLVVADTAPAALEAARRAGLPAVAVGNFTWPWTYQHYPQLSDWAERLATWQAGHPAAELWPGPGMVGFAPIERFGLIGRRAENIPQWPSGRVLVSFGGFGLSDLQVRLPVLDGVTWVLAPPMARLDRPDCLFIDDLPYPSLVAAADVVVTKPGYGILAETARARTKVVWVPRGAFPESRFITEVLTHRGDRKANLSPEAGAAEWRDELSRVVSQRLADPLPAAPPPDDSAGLADWLIQQASLPARRR